MFFLFTTVRQKVRLCLFLRLFSTRSPTTQHYLWARLQSSHHISTRLIGSFFGLPISFMSIYTHRFVLYNLRFVSSHVQTISACSLSSCPQFETPLKLPIHSCIRSVSSCYSTRSSKRSHFCYVRLLFYFPGHCSVGCNIEITN